MYLHSNKIIVFVEIKTVVKSKFFGLKKSEEIVEISTLADKGYQCLKDLPEKLLLKTFRDWCVKFQDDREVYIQFCCDLRTFNLLKQKIEHWWFHQLPFLLELQKEFVEILTECSIDFSEQRHTNRLYHNQMFFNAINETYHNYLNYISNRMKSLEEMSDKLLAQNEKMIDVVAKNNEFLLKTNGFDKRADAVGEKVKPKRVRRTDFQILVDDFASFEKDSIFNESFYKEIKNVARPEKPVSKTSLSDYKRLVEVYTAMIKVAKEYNSEIKQSNDYAKQLSHSLNFKYPSLELSKDFIKKYINQ